MFEEHYAFQQANLTAALAVIADSAAFINVEATKLQVNLELFELRVQSAYGHRSTIRCVVMLFSPPLVALTASVP